MPEVWNWLREIGIKHRIPQPLSSTTLDPFMADLIGNEKVKLSASWMNTLSAATYTGGVALPIIGQFTRATHMDMGVLITLVGVCLILAVAIHWYGQSLLGNLDDAD